KWIGIAKFTSEIAFRRGAHYMKDFLRIANRQGAPQRRVEERKYRCVGSDAERENQHSNCGKAGILAQLPQRVAKILCQSAHLGFAPLLAHRSALVRASPTAPLPPIARLLQIQ